MNMNISVREREFDKLVKNKFNIYNSLFLNLPFKNVSNTGILIPQLYEACKNGLSAGKEPIEILDAFFDANSLFTSEEEKIDFMFKVIQYVERQVVLYDSVEDSAFDELQKFSNTKRLNDYFHLLEKKEDGNRISAKLATFNTRIVFTAHPTQFYPLSVLDIISRLRKLVTENNIHEIDLTLQQLGLTSLTNVKKPTPFEEAKNVIYFLRNFYYEAVGEIYTYIKKNIQHFDYDNSRIIELGFWPGGDRDGNPFVTSDVTLKVADELRMTLMKCYYQDVKNLENKLTFRKVEQIIADLRLKLYASMFNSENMVTYNEIIKSLNSVKELLNENYNGLFLDELEKILDKVNVFKTHFASLDIRQNHSVHYEVIESILIKENIIKDSLTEISKEELMSILVEKDLNITPDYFEDGLYKDTVKTIQSIKVVQSKNGELGCNRYIISNSEDIYSVLFVYALLRWCSWQNEQIKIDIIPLFESMEGMSNSKEIMDELFKIPAYRKHVYFRKNIQTIMLGFSDGTKDGGYLQANWSIYRTKENLTEICRKHNIEPIFFDGRGGPPARGGGKTHRFYASQSNKISNNAIQLTIQGQTISSKYGTKEHFIHNIEQLLTAGLSISLFDKENVISDKHRVLIEQLAKLSFESYNRLKNHDKFISYLENKSTLKYYSKANIGSRPSKRGDKEKLELTDLRAISFVGSWSQLKQNVPGYFGIGTAIKTLVDDGRLDDLKELFNNVSFFKALILNSMMSLTKSNFELTSYIAKDEEYKEFWNILSEEYELSKEMVLLISDYKFLMQEEHVSRSSIQIREKIVLPLLLIQQYALQKIEKKVNTETYGKIVSRSLYGNINASRNSA